MNKILLNSVNFSSLYKDQFLPTLSANQKQIVIIALAFFSGCFTAMAVYHFFGKKKVTHQEIPKETLHEEIPKETLLEEIPKETLHEEIPKETLLEEIPKETLLEEIPKETLHEEIPDDSVKSTTMQIYLKTLTSMKEGYLVSSNDTIGKIKKFLHDGIPSDLQIFVFKGDELEDNLTLKECGISNESTIHVIQRFKSVFSPKSVVLTIFLRSAYPETRTYYVEQNDTIGMLKTLIHIKGHTKVDIQDFRLLYGSELLNDNATWNDYQIKSQSTLHFWVGLRGD